MAEIELSALSKQCLDRKIAYMKILADEVRTWEKERNAIGATVKWRFNRDNARIKLKRHYLNLLNQCYKALVHVRYSFAYLPANQPQTKISSFFGSTPNSSLRLAIHSAGLLTLKKMP